MHMDKLLQRGMLRHHIPPPAAIVSTLPPNQNVVSSPSHNIRRHACLFSHKTSSTSMEEKKEATSDPARECRGKKACDETNANKIIPHILNLYAACAKPSDFEIYAPDASFEDPLMRAEGVKQIKSAFYSLSKVFKESKIVDYTIQENTTSLGKQEIVIDNKQHYKFLGRNIDMTSLIKLYVEDGKIVRHEDWWGKKPLKNRDTVNLPLVGRMIETARRGAMLATHAMMGFGKDPDSDHS